VPAPPTLTATPRRKNTTARKIKNVLVPATSFVVSTLGIGVSRIRFKNVLLFGSPSLPGDEPALAIWQIKASSDLKQRAVWLGEIGPVPPLARRQVERKNAAGSAEAVDLWWPAAGCVAETHDSSEERSADLKSWLGQPMGLRWRPDEVFRHRRERTVENRRVASGVRFTDRTWFRATVV